MFVRPTVRTVLRPGDCVYCEVGALVEETEKEMLGLDLWSERMNQQRHFLLERAVGAGRRFVHLS